MEQHESKVAEQTVMAINQLLETYQKLLKQEEIKEKNRYKMEIFKTLIISIVVIILGAMLLLAPSKIDIKNVAESRTENRTGGVTSEYKG